jgi:hypothetical protein
MSNDYSLAFNYLLGGLLGRAIQMRLMRGVSVGACVVLVATLAVAARSTVATLVGTGMPGYAETR